VIVAARDRSRSFDGPSGGRKERFVRKYLLALPALVPLPPASRGVLLAAILTAMLAPMSTVALASGASPEPLASPVDASPVSEAIHGWPGAKAEPAGLYSWTLPPIGSRWMHKVPGTWTSTAPNSVELTFHTSVDRPRGMGMSHGILGPWWEEGPFDEHPVRVHEVRTEVWLLDIEGARVAILLDSFPDTDPELVAEAQAVIESIVAKPTKSGHRIVVRLLEGWDSG
jgi:hypothetical protein